MRVAPMALQLFLLALSAFSCLPCIWSVQRISLSPPSARSCPAARGLGCTASFIAGTSWWSNLLRSCPCFDVLVLVALGPLWRVNVADDARSCPNGLHRILYSITCLGVLLFHPGMDMERREECVASVLRGHRLGHPGVVGWPSRWIGLALPASIAYTALGGILPSFHEIRLSFWPWR